MISPDFRIVMKYEGEIRGQNKETHIDGCEEL